MKCLTCGSDSTGNFCNTCGRPLRCSSCGSSNIDQFCGNCGKLIKKENPTVLLPKQTKQVKKPFLRDLLEDQLLPLGVITFLLITLGVFYFFYRNSDTTADALDTLFNKEGVTEPAEPVDPVYREALSLIENLKFEEALIELKKVKPDSPSFKKAQAKIDEIRFPLAQARLDVAKELFEQKKYIEAYQNLQQAYGAITPPLQEAMDLAPIYEKASYAQSMGQEISEEDIKIQKKDYEFDDVNARWFKSAEETNGYDWIAMTEKQKAYILSLIIFDWKKEGKSIAKDSIWFTQKLNDFYNNNQKEYSLTRALDMIYTEENYFK